MKLPVITPPAQVRSHILDTFIGCERKGFFAHMMHIRPKSEKVSDSLVIGSYLHAFAERDSGGDKNALARTTKEYREKMRASTGKAEWGNIDNCLNDWLLIAKVMWRSWLKRNKPFGLPGIKGAKGTPHIIGAELEVNFKIEGLTHERPNPETGKMETVEQEVGGRVDLAAGLNLNKTLYIWPEDWKTSGIPLDQRAATLALEWATFIYPMSMAVYAHRKGFKKFAIPGMNYNIIEKFKIRVSSADEKAFSVGTFASVEDAFFHRVQSWYDGTGEYKKDADMLRLNPRMRRCWVVFHTDWFEVVDNNTVRLLPNKSALTGERVRSFKRLCKLMNQTDVLPYQFEVNRQNCYTYRRPCPYLQLCTTSELTWPARISKDFIIDPNEAPEESD